RDNAGGARLSLGEQSTVQTGDDVADIDRYLTWDVAGALERIAKYQPGPFDLDVELQEEIVLRNWSIGAPEVREAEKHVWYPFAEEGVALTGVVSAQNDGQAQRRYLDELRKEKPVPLFGLLHYEKCRLIFQPLTLFGPKGIVHLMLSPEKIDRA